MRYRSELTPYQPFPFNGNFSNNWGAHGLVRFVDLATNTVLLDIQYERALMTTWSQGPGVMGPTATVQGSEDLDPGLQFIPGVELVNILVGAGSRWRC